MGVIMDACIALRLCTITLDACRIVPAALPQLTRLIVEGALHELRLFNDDVEMFDESHESTRLFAAAVRASAMTAF